MADETKYAYVPMYVVTLVFVGFLIYLLVSRKGQVVQFNTPACSTCTSVVPVHSLTGGQSGQKRALLIGLNYNFPGSICIQDGCVLNGCIDDVNNITSFLSNHGFQIERLVDDGTTPMPTKTLILQTLSALISGMQAGDTTFVWYSGHGAQIPNSASDEGYDECWCPPDTLENGNYLRDAELDSIFSRAPLNSTVFIGSDSCHSGTIVDLPYFLSPVGQPVVARQLPAKKALGKRAVIADDMKGGARSVQAMTVIHDTSFPATAANVICLSGCQNWDTSADAFEAGSAQGR
jgi:hypothetical protein